MSKPEIREPQDGGCWYCMTVDEDLEFCCEFDCYVHRECVEQRLKDDPDDREAKFIGFMNLLPQVERLKDLTTASAVIHQCRVDALNALADKVKELDMTPKETVMLLVGNGLPRHDIEAVGMRLGFAMDPIIAQIREDQDQ